MPDAVLLDWSMPNMDGLEFISEAPQRTRRRATPVVVFCAAENEPGPHRRSACPGG